MKMRMSALVVMAIAGVAQVCLAQQPAQKSFPSAEEAARVLFEAARTHDEQALMATLGLGKELLSLGDAVQDKLDREQFAEKYREMHRLAGNPGGPKVLYVGAENWPFPIPLKSSQGAWMFDSSAGVTELLFRRIGENELAAIQTCRELVTGSAGTIDLTRPLHGYWFRRLKSQTGAAFVAYPSGYRSSGVMTFVAGQDGIYERDLGGDTGKAATSMSQYQHDSTWHAAE